MLVTKATFIAIRRIFSPFQFVSILFQPAIRTQVSDLVSSVRTLHQETKQFLSERASGLVSFSIITIFEIQLEHISLYG